MLIMDRLLDDYSVPYIVAEMSCNHGGDLKNAVRLIKAAKTAGADAIKTQCYDADSMTIDCGVSDFIVQEGLWKGRKLYDLYKQTATPPMWHASLYQVAKDEGIAIFSSVFDERGVDLLEKLGCPAYKIASFEANDTRLIRYAASTGKPLIISTGIIGWSRAVELSESLDKQAAFLHCVSDYPTLSSSANLERIRLMQESIIGVVGLSDHTVDPMIPVMATALGVGIIEKHIKLKDIETEDAAFSLDEEGFAAMVNDVLRAAEAMGGWSTAEGDRKHQFKRSLYCIKDIAAGEIMTEQHIRSIRPGYGADPSTLDQFIGQPAPQDYRRGEPI